VTELVDCRRGRPLPGGSWWVVLSRSPRAPGTWEAGAAPCTVLVESATYPAGVGITVLRFGAVTGSGSP